MGGMARALGAVGRNERVLLRLYGFMPTPQFRVACRVASGKAAPNGTLRDTASCLVRFTILVTNQRAAHSFLHSPWRVLRHLAVALFCRDLVSSIVNLTRQLAVSRSVPFGAALPDATRHATRN